MAKYILIGITLVAFFWFADAYIDNVATRRVWNMYYSGEISEDVLFDTLIELGEPD